MNFLTVFMLKFNMLMIRIQMLDVVAGITSAKSSAMGTIKPVVNQVVVPLCAVAAGIFALINIVKCVRRHRGGEEFQENLFVVAICVIVLTVVLSFPTWGWSMMGQ